MVEKKWFPVVKKTAGDRRKLPFVADPPIDCATTSFAITGPRGDRIPMNDRGSGTEGSENRQESQKDRRVSIRITEIIAALERHIFGKFVIMIYKNCRITALISL